MIHHHRLCLTLKTHGNPVIVVVEKTTYESEGNRVSYIQFTTEFIGLPEFTIASPHKAADGSWVCSLTPRQKSFPCPLCGQTSVNHSREKVRRLRHRFVPGWGTVHVTVPIYRQRCKDCDLTWTVEWPGISPGRTKSTNCYIASAVHACYRSDIQSVAREWGIAYTTLERWYYRIASASTPSPKAYGSPRIVCMDEFAIKRGHKYCVALMDHSSGHVWQVFEGKSRESIQAALKKWPFPDIPEVVITDLAPGMADTIREVWPKTVVVADKFHVLCLFFHKLNTQRKLSMDNPTKHKAVRFRKKLLTTDPKNLTAQEQEELAKLLESNWKLSDLYQGLQEIRSIYSCTNTADGIKRFREWLLMRMFDGCGAVRNIAKTLSQWTDEVTAYFSYRVTNAPMEGTNNLIKTLKRRAYGYRNMERFTLRIRLECRQPDGADSGAKTIPIAA